MSLNSELRLVIKASKGAGYPTGTDQETVVADSHPVTVNDTYSDDNIKRTDRQGGSKYVSGFTGSCPVRGPLRANNWETIFRLGMASAPVFLGYDTTAGDLAIAAGTLTLTSGDWPAGFTAGRVIQLTKAAGDNPAEMVLFITARTSSKILAVAGATLLAETPAGVTQVRNNWLTTGTTKEYALLEEILGTGEYRYLDDAVCQRIAYNAPATGAVMIEADFAGRNGGNATSSLNTADQVLAGTTNGPVVADTAVLALRLDNTELSSTVDVIDCNLTINGNVAPYDAQRHRGPADFDWDSFMVEAILSVRWQNGESFIRSYIAAQKADSSTVALMRVDSDRQGNRFGWVLPRCKRTNHDLASGGKDDKTVVPLTYSAERHPTYGYIAGLFYFPAAPVALP